VGKFLEPPKSSGLHSSRVQGLAACAWPPAVLPLGMTDGALEFRVERWDDADNHVVELIAASNNSIVGQAAYRAAVEQMPRANLMLRHRARVIFRSRPG
jgi:hypothetical protein